MVDSSQSSLMEGSAFIFPGQAVYVKLDADVVRDFSDKTFASFAKNTDADSISGAYHRWAKGHDLAVDILETLSEHGPVRAFNQAAHIVLTDLPTKDGIPIPGLSGSSSLGPWLVDAGVPKGYLMIHWADGALGFLFIQEGSTDLIQAMQGSLAMNTTTFFDTFVEGGIEIAVALALKSAWGLRAFNPLFAIIGGAENILAGIISVYQKYTIYVDPLVFFGSAGTSALIGFGLAYLVAGESLSNSSLNGIRGGAVGALYSLSPLFGYGALAGFVSYNFGRKLAEVHNESMRVLMSVDESAYQQLLDELCKGNVHLKDFLNRAEKYITLADTAPTLTTESAMFNTNVQVLSDQFQQLESVIQLLPESPAQLDSKARALPSDP